jgi:methionyl-tRNA synthetase
VPETRKNEVLSFIGAGLLDFSVSRSRARAHGWGIPVPDDPEQVIYVWFDALGNYITALDYAQEDALYQRYWVDNPRRVHVIGKGITRFHAVYWPAMLLSAGVPLPTTIFIHGYITLGGDKVSKSLGNAVDPVDLAAEYGADALRYYLLREIKATEDGDFTPERFIRAYNNDLADQLGNLLSRLAGMVKRYCDGVVPAPTGITDVDRALIDPAEALRERVDEAMREFAPHAALAAIWDLIGAANKYVVEVRPWELAKRRPDDPNAAARLATALYNLAEALRLIAHYCAPFLPTTAEAIIAQLGLSLNRADDWAQVSQWGGYPPGTAIQPGMVLFPKLQLPAIDKHPNPGV